MFFKSVGGNVQTADGQGLAGNTVKTFCGGSARRNCIFKFFCQVQLFQNFLQRISDSYKVICIDIFATQCIDFCRSNFYGFS